jgi:hypothetical protein
MVMNVARRYSLVRALSAIGSAPTKKGAKELALECTGSSLLTAVGAIMDLLMLERLFSSSIPPVSFNFVAKFSVLAERGIDLENIYPNESVVWIATHAEAWTISRTRRPSRTLPWTISHDA